AASFRRLLARVRTGTSSSLAAVSSLRSLSASLISWSTIASSESETSMGSFLISGVAVEAASAAGRGEMIATSNAFAGVVWSLRLVFAELEDGLVALPIRRAARQVSVSRIWWGSRLERRTLTTGSHCSDVGYVKITLVR